MRFYKILSALIFLFLCSTFLFAQNDDVINVDSTLVRLNVGVVNRSGQAVTNLDKNNFTLYENGVKQEITRFEPTVAPFSVVMILDMSGSTLGFRQTIQTSAFRFIDALSPDDRIAVIV
jgi:VWFA-related protein